MGNCKYPPAAFNKRLVVHNPTRVSDGQGGFAETWTPAAVVWASLEPVKGYERYQAMQTATPVSHKLVTRANPAVTTASRFVLGTRSFGAKEVLDRGEAGRFLDVRTLELKAVPYLSNDPAGAILLETGGYLQLEDGSRLLLETTPGSGRFALEGGGTLSLETGGTLLLEA